MKRTVNLRRTLRRQERALTVTLDVKFGYMVRLGLLVMRLGAWLVGLKMEVEHDG